MTERKSPFAFLRRLFRWKRQQPDEAVDVDALMAAFEKKHATPIKRRSNAKTPRKPSVQAETNCPTPRKVRYSSLSAAKNHRSWKANKGARMRAYKCRCGGWHLARREA